MTSKIGGRGLYRSPCESQSRKEPRRGPGRPRRMRRGRPVEGSDYSAFFTLMPVSELTAAASSAAEASPLASRSTLLRKV